MAKVPSPNSANPFDTVEKTQKGRPKPAPTAPASPNALRAEKEAKAATPFRPPTASGTKQAVPVSPAPPKPANDGFSSGRSVHERAAPASAPVLPPGPRPTDSFAVLHAALEHGTYFIDEDEEKKGRGALEPDFAAALEEARKLLAKVNGVVRVGPGRNEARQRVILVVTSQGFGEASMQQVPEKVKGFSTLITVPYTLLPLRRER